MNLFLAVASSLLLFAPSLVAESDGFRMVARTDRKRVLQAADLALKAGPLTITQDRSPLSEGSPNEFFSMSDYYWPDPEKADGKPYTMRDGQSNPGNFNTHRETLMAMRDATTALAAAYLLKKDEGYAEKAISLWKVFFLDETTRMHPSLEHAQAIIGKPTPKRGTGLIDTLHLIEVPLAILALKDSKAMTPETFAGLKRWFQDYTDWLIESPKGQNEANARNNHAVAYWLQVAAFSSLTKDEKRLELCRHQFKEVFLPAQMAVDGSFPLELARTKPYAYSIFQMDNMSTLCQLLSISTDNLWTYETADGKSMARAVGYLYPYLADKSTWPLKPDVHAWEGWPVRQSSLLFGGIAFHDSKYLKLWRELKPDPEDFEIRRNNAITQPLLWVALFDHSTATPEPKKVRADEVFDLEKPVVFEENFQSGNLDSWKLSVDDRYGLAVAEPGRLQIVDAPGRQAGAKAVRFVVPRARNSFRSEISLPHEDGFFERWYAVNILIPENWVFDPDRAQDIVIQWHAIPGNWKPTHPNLAISLSNENWFIKQSFGSPQNGPERLTHRLKQPVQKGKWVSWGIHARWSPKADGLIQVWQDGKEVLHKTGANVYGSIGVEYTPYMKTGIYRPEWHVDTEAKLKAFDEAKPVATSKSIYISEVKIGSERASLEDFVSSKQP